MIINSPLRIVRPRSKDWILNLNVYRNSHYMTLNGVKVKYKALVQDQIDTLPAMDKISTTFILFPKTRRRTDLANVLSIHEKFLLDAIVESGKLPDDDYMHHVQTTYLFGEVDKEAPRVEVHIKQEI